MKQPHDTHTVLMQTQFDSVGCGSQYLMYDPDLDA